MVHDKHQPEPETTAERTRIRRDRHAAHHSVDAAHARAVLVAVSKCAARSLRDVLDIYARDFERFGYETP